MDEAPGACDKHHRPRQIRRPRQCRLGMAGRHRRIRPRGIHRAAAEAREPCLSIAEDAPTPFDTVSSNPLGTKKGYDPYDSGKLGKTAAAARKKDLRRLSEWLEIEEAVCADEQGRRRGIADSSLARSRERVAQFRRAPQSIESAQLAHQRLDPRLSAIHEALFQPPAILRGAAMRRAITIILIRLQTRIEAHADRTGAHAPGPDSRRPAGPASKNTVTAYLSTSAWVSSSSSDTGKSRSSRQVEYTKWLTPSRAVQ